MNIKFIAVIILTSVVITGCAAQHNNSKLEKVTLTNKQNCDNLTLSVGQELTITLPSSPSTGFSWTVVKQPNVLQLTHTPKYEQDPSPQNNNTQMVGMSGTTSWFYKAQNIGTDTLEMIYHRPWETKKKPAETFSCTINVH